MKTTRKQRNEIYKQVSEMLKINNEFICNVLAFDLKIDGDLKKYPELHFIVSESIFDGGAISVNDNSIDDYQYVLIKHICLDLAQLID
jgi:hypothetical protein